MRARSARERDQKSESRKMGRKSDATRSLPDQERVSETALHSLGAP